MLFRSHKNWIFDLFLRRGWLAKRQRLRRREQTWSRPSTVAAECQCLEERILLSTITVTSLADSLNAGNGVTLRDAIQAANTDTSVDGSVAGEANTQNVINFTPGLAGTIALSLGQLTISSTMKIEGLGAANTIIDAQQSSRIFNITVMAGNVSLDSLTLENGMTTENGPGSENAPPGNGEGGAIQSFSTGTLNVQNSVLSGNSTTGNAAAGGAIFASAPIVLTNSTLAGNFTTGVVASGGAIAVNQLVTVTVTATNSTFSGNFTAGNGAKGGAIADTSGAVTVSGSTFSGNSTAGGDSNGGAIFGQSAVTLTNSTFTGNSTSGPSAHGGAIFAGGALTVTNSTISGNSTKGGTTGGTGGGIFAAAGLTVANTILAQNTDNGIAPEIFETGGVIRFSLIGDNTGTGLAAAPVGKPDANGDLIGTHTAPIDPKLGPLADNGGPTQTLAELAGSPAIDSGNDLLAIDPQTSSLLTNDQRGASFNRILGAAVDMGAYEVEPLGTVIFTGEYSVALPGPFGFTLASIQQNGTQLTLNGSTTVTATVTSPTTLLVGGVTASYGNSKITFGSTGPFANQVWTKLDLPTDYTNPAGAIVHIYQNGNAVTFSDRNGITSPGTWLSPTRLFGYGEAVTIGSGPFQGELRWNDGTIWNTVVSLTGTSNGSAVTIIETVPSKVLVTDYLTASGTRVHTVQTGTTNIVFIDGNANMVLGTYSSPNTTVPQATAPAYPGWTASIAANTITWTDGNPADTILWTKTTNHTAAITITDYTNQNGVPVHVVQNGTTEFVIVDGLGNVSLGHFVTATTAIADNYPTDAATFSGNQVIWADGVFVWTSTNNPPPLLITFVDANNAISHIQLPTRTTLIGIDGPLQGVQGTRQNGTIVWSNGDVWDNFDFDALNAFFEIATGFA